MRPPTLRPGLLEGTAVLVAGVVPEGPLGASVAERSRALGATVRALAVDPDGDPPDPAAIDPAADQVVWDGAGAFAAAGGASIDATRAALDGAWLAIRPAATRAFLEPGRPGKVTLLAPPPGGAHAEAARAGLENLARTLSVEWSRFGIRVVTIHPGAATEPATVAELCAFLASPAGDYHSGSLLALDAVAP